MTLPLNALVLAAGKGTRMNSAKPKVLHEAGGVSLLRHVLDVCGELGAATSVVVGHQADSVRKHAEESGNVRTVLQEPQLGTGHAVQIALRDNPALRNATLLVVAGDVPLLRAATLRELLRLKEDSRAAVAFLSFRNPSPANYGRIVRDERGRVAKIVEAKDANPAELQIQEVNASVYAFDGEKLALAASRLGSRNSQGEFYLTDVVELLARDGGAVVAMSLEDASEAQGVNTLSELAQVERIIYLNRSLAMIEAGASIERPDTVLIGPRVVVRPGARVRAFSVLEGDTTIEAGACVGPFSRVEDTVVGPNATILDSCLVRSSRIEAGATVGPFAHIRPDSVVGENSKVGNFVELKNTVLGTGAKAPHLSYVGDASVGAHSNLGAGTITCNYDGVVKSRTTIEEDAFIGSNSILVAPVTVGKGAYVAAGSVITKNVPEGALAVARSRQENKPGWAARRRSKKS